MNKELFASMREQMRPGEEVRAALEEKLAAPQKRRVPARRYAAVAACAAVIAAAVPVYGAVQDHLKWRAVLGGFHPDAVIEPFEPHSYVLAEELDCWPEDNAVTENSTDTGAGDQDQDMTDGELTDNMLEAGFGQEDVAGYLASGWQMTWANWWKFCHQSEESGDRSLEALLAFSQEEGLAVNTGEASEMPGGACAGVDQGEAVMAYQNLMDRFKADYGLDKYPEWYGGAYIDENAGLIVNIVEQLEPEGKELFLQIQDWAGSSRIGFGSSGFSLNHLRELQDRAFDAMYEMGLAVGCGVNEETGQVELTLNEVNEEALWKLAELDPADTAILVVIEPGDGVEMVEELAPAPAAPSVSRSVQPSMVSDAPDTPVAYIPGVGEVVGWDAIRDARAGMDADEDGVTAYEPQGE